MRVRLVMSWLIADLKCDTSGFVVVQCDAVPRLILQRWCPRARDTRRHAHGPRLWLVRSQTESRDRLPRSCRSCEEQGPRALPALPPTNPHMVSLNKLLSLG